MNVQELSRLLSQLFESKFGDAPDPLVMTQNLAQHAALTSYEPGQTLLNEGSINTKLFVLVHGECEVLSQSEQLTLLNHPGELMGEMSLISQLPCSASIKATQSTTVLTIDFGLAPTAIQPELYRFLSLLLAERLKNTNQKAKLFEQTYRELAEVAEQRLKEIELKDSQFYDQFKKLTLQQLDITKINPNSDNLSHFFDHLKKLQLLGQQLHDTQGKKIIIYDSRPEQQSHVKLALGGTGLVLVTPDNLEECLHHLQQETFDLLWVDQSSLENLTQDPGYASCKKPHYVILSTEKPLAEHPTLLKKYPLVSILMSHHPFDKAFMVKNSFTSVKKLTTRDIFGLEKYLSWGTPLQTSYVNSSNERSQLISKMEQDLQSFGIRGPLLRRCALVAEELLMNAIYDAPTDAAGKALYNHIDRSQPVELKENERALFQYGCDGTIIGLSILDPFGALSKETLLKHIERCTQNIQQTDAEKKGGGGYGLFQILKSSSLVIFNIQPQVKTEVIALFNLNIQTDKTATIPSFHFFTV